MQYQVIKSMTDANILLDLGNLIKKIDRDRNDRTRLIFLFANTDKLKQDLAELNDKKNKDSDL